MSPIRGNPVSKEFLGRLIVQAMTASEEKSEEAFPSALTAMGMDPSDPLDCEHGFMAILAFTKESCRSTVAVPATA